MITRGSLALSGLGMSITSVIYDMKLYIFKSHKISETLTESFLSYVTELFMASSFLHISLMALQRLCAIKYPLEYSLITKRKQSRILAIIWIFGIIIFLIAYILEKKMTDLSQRIRFWCWIRLSFTVVPSSTTVIATIAMCLAYYKYTKSGPVGAETKRNKKQENNHWQVVRMTCMIVVGNLIGSWPHCLVYVYYINKNYIVVDDYSEILCVVLNTLLFLSGTVDFFSYILFDNHFKRFLKTALSNSCEIQVEQPDIT